MKRSFALAACGVLFSASLGCGRSSAPAKFVSKAASKDQLLKVTGQITGLVFSPDGHTLAIAWDGGKRFELWHVNKRKKIFGIGPPSSMLFGASFDPTGENLAVSSFNTTRIWNLKQQKCTFSFPSSPYAARFISADKIWVGSNKPPDFSKPNAKRTLLLRSVLKSKQLDKFNVPVETLEFDFIANKRIVISSDGPNLWGWNTVKKRMQFHVMQTVPQRAVNQPFLTFFLVGKAIAWSYELGGFQIRSVQTGRLIWKMNYAGIYDIAASPRGDILATAHLDHRVRLWDLKTHKLLRVLRGHQSEVFCLAFSSDGRTLASGDYQGQVLIWHLK